MRIDNFIQIAGEMKLNNIKEEEAKEKWACESETRGDLDNQKWMIDNIHIILCILFYASWALELHKNQSIENIYLEMLSLGNRCLGTNVCGAFLFV